METIVKSLLLIVIYLNPILDCFTDTYFIKYKILIINNPHKQ